MLAPDFSNRQPSEIVSEKLFFDSAGFAYRGLSWLDYAKRTGSITTLLYSALDMRLAIEHLLFEELIMSVGGQLDRTEYEKCKGNSTKLTKIIHRLSPDYQQLVIFTRTISALIPNSPPLIEWEHDKLLKHWGALSTFLHWPGETKETFESAQWFTTGLATVEGAGSYLWERMTSGYSGVMPPEKMQREIRQIWEDFKSRKIDIDSARERARIALPVLTMRIGT